MIAAASHAPTASGPALPRLEREHAKTMVINAALASTSLARSCASDVVTAMADGWLGVNSMLARATPKLAPAS